MNFHIMTREGIKVAKEEGVGVEQEKVVADQESSGEVGTSKVGEGSGEAGKSSGGLGDQWRDSGKVGS